MSSQQAAPADDAEFLQMAANRVGGLRALLHEQNSGLDRHIPHRGAVGRFDNRSSIVGVVLTLHERLDVVGQSQQQCHPALEGTVRLCLPQGVDHLHQHRVIHAASMRDRGNGKTGCQVSLAEPRRSAEHDVRNGLRRQVGTRERMGSRIRVLRRVRVHRRMHPRMRSGRCQCMPHLKPSEFSGFGPHLTLQLTCCRTERCIFAIGRFIRARCERPA